MPMQCCDAFHRHECAIAAHAWRAKYASLFPGPIRSDPSGELNLDALGASITVIADGYTAHDCGSGDTCLLTT